MPQRQLPIFPVGTVHINSQIGFQRQEDQVVYLNGHLPVFTHRVNDLASFRLITSQLLANGTVTQREVARAFQVPLTTIKRYSKKLRQDGVAGFFCPPVKRQGHKLTSEVLDQVQALLDAGASVPAISSQTGVLKSTLHKAIASTRLKKKRPSPPAVG